MSAADNTLPAGDSPDLHLVEATPEELEVQQHAHFTAWGGALSEEAYMRRERLLYSPELTQDATLTAWMLVHQRPGSAARQVLCGCESVKKKALVWRNGQLDEVIAYGVASVFCRDSLRGRGYAGRMMTELGKRLRKWHADEGKEVLFSVLFSDIGKKFYAARGWHAFPSSHVALPVTATPTTQTLPSLRLLKSADLAELCELDEKLLRRRLAKRDGKSVAVALLPDHSTMRWHHAREEFTANELIRRQPTIKGAVVGEPGSRVWCYWSHVWTNPQEEAPNTLHLLRLGIEDETFDDFAAATQEGVVKARGTSTSAGTVAAIAALFNAAREEAAQWDLKEVVLWNPTSTSLAAAQLLEPDIQVVDRQDESITSLLWYGEGSHEDVEWVCNEKYGWC